LHGTEYHRIKAFFCPTKEQIFSNGNHHPTGLAKRSFNRSPFGVSDVVSFDFQHLFPNSHFSISFIFQQIGSQTGAFCSGTPVALTRVGNGSQLVDLDYGFLLRQVFRFPLGSLMCSGGQ